MPHFTYKSSEELETENCLKQGDILKRTEALDNIIKNIHPYFDNDEYKYFIVLTQTCDLVQKGASNKLKHINLSAVRTLSSILEKESQQLYKTDLERKVNLLNKNKQAYFEDLLRRLLNNNVPEYFYLHRDIDNSISEPHVASLRVSIALKAQEHYNTCLEAKVLELKDEFKAKLGWLIGNLYSRVATQDWTPKIKTEHEFKHMIREILNNHFIFKEDKDAITKELLKTNSLDELLVMNKAELLSKIEKFKFPDIKTKVKERLETLIKKANIVNDNDIGTLSNIIANDTSLKDLIKQNN